MTRHLPAVRSPFHPSRTRSQVTALPPKRVRVEVVSTIEFIVEELDGTRHRFTLTLDNARSTEVLADALRLSYLVTDIEVT